MGRNPIWKGSLNWESVGQKVVMRTDFGTLFESTTEKMYLKASAVFFIKSCIFCFRAIFALTFVKILSTCFNIW